MSAPFASFDSHVPVDPRHHTRRTEDLPDMELSSGRLRGSLRCAVLGLTRGDCQQQKLPDSIYCYYHDKLHKGQTSTDEDLYPVWPLPDYPHKLGEVRRARRLRAA